MLRFCAVLLILACANGAPNVTNVHVVFMNHLDVGFNHGETLTRAPCLFPPYEPNCGFALSIINNYFDNYFPEAVATGLAVNTQGSPKKFIYTTQAFLVRLYVECDSVLAIMPGLHCPSPTALAAFTASLTRGDIVFHAFPFNAEPELCDEHLFSYGVGATVRLAQKLGLPPPRAMSQRDVPGMTRAVIPLLKASGVIGISVGVNEATSPPAVPRAFVWKSTNNDSVLAMWHPNGYGWMEGTVPQLPGDCLVVPGLPDALCFAFKGDNRGPQNVSEVQQDYAALTKLFPGTSIFASTIDAYFDRLATVADTLPVVTNEIGDTWMYGSASDPGKTAQLREIARARAECIQSNRCSVDDPAFDLFSFIFLKLVEHTWGMDVKNFLIDWGNWTNPLFDSARGGANYRLMEASWNEQRAFVAQAIQALGISDFAGELGARLAALSARAKAPNLSGYSKVDASSVFTVGTTRIGFSGAGAISTLCANGTCYASASRPLAQLRYDTYGAAAYDTWLSQYLNCFPPPNGPASCYFAPEDFGKPGLDKFPEVIRQTVHATLSGVWMQNTTGGATFLVESAFPSGLSVNFGAPTSQWLEVVVDDHQPGHIQLRVVWLNKTATRLPESLALTFNPVPVPGAQWRMRKLGEMIDPLNVVFNGSRTLHGVDPHNGAVTYGSFSVTAIDSALVAPGGSALLTFTNEQPALAANGIDWVLFNNLYDTNYIMWYPWLPEDSASSFRFVLDLH